MNVCITDFSRAITPNSSDSDDVEHIFHSSPWQEYISNGNEKVQQLDKYLKELENPKKNKTCCKICDMELKTTIHAQKHYNSVNHMRRFSELRQKAIHDISLSVFAGKKYLCKICNLNVNHDVLNDHFNSEQHKRNLEVFCTVCEVRTVSKNALLEHINLSLTHRNIMKEKQDDSPRVTSPEQQTRPCKVHGGQSMTFDSAMVSDRLTIPRVCITPKIPSRQSSNGYDSPYDLHENSPVKTSTDSDSVTAEKWQHYCRICDIKLSPEHFYTHMTAFPHSVIDMLKSQYTSTTIDEFCSVTNNGKELLCHLCNITMRQLGDVKSHLNATKHIKKFKNRFPELTSQDKKDNANKYNGTSCSIAKAESKAEKDLLNDNKSTKDSLIMETVELKVDMEPLKTDRFFCYLCKLDFKGRAEFHAHVTSFPHVEMARWKSEVVSLGVPYAEYWVQYEASLICTLCDVQVNNFAKSKSHMSDSKHKTRLSEWCKEFISWQLGDVTDPKYFYCRACDLRLPGTSDADNHYSTNAHLKRLELFCKLCQVSNSTEKMLLDHQMSNEHKEMIFKETLDKIDHKNTAENPDSEMPTIDIEMQIFQQVEKLVHTLYYSKSVPFDVALNYLRRINAEVAELKDNYGTKSNPEPLGKLISTEGVYQTPLKNGEAMNHSLNQCNKKEYILESFIGNNHTGDGLLRVTIEEKQNEIQEAIIYSQEVQDQIKTLDESMEQNKSKTLITLENEKLDGNRLILLEDPDFLSLYQNIMKLRQRISEPSTERDILDEIKHIIYAVNTTGAPLDKVLVALRNFNANLDSALLKFKYKNKRWDI